MSGAYVGLDDRLVRAATLLDDVHDLVRVAETGVAFLDWFITFVGHETYAEIKAPELRNFMTALVKSGAMS